MTPKRPDIELVKLLPFESSEVPLQELTAKFEEEFSREATATEERALSQEFTRTLNSQEWREEDSAGDLEGPPQKKSKDSQQTSEESWEIPDSELFDDES